VGVITVTLATLPLTGGISYKAGKSQNFAHHHPAGMHRIPMWA